ncbi:TPA: aldo/keto reductase [bacterium]|nr:aldo/keto reductase [bacterium]
MLKKRLGRTELMVSVIGFGGLIIPRISHDEAIELIKYALDHGVNIIDTAKSYGDSEEKIGSAIKDRKDCIITTKSLADNAEALLSDIDLQLRRLNRDKIELYQIHNISTQAKLENTLKQNGLLDALKQAKKDKKIDFIGFSGHNKGILAKAIETNEFDFVEMPINVIDRNVWCDTLSLALERDMGVIAMKPLAGGALTDMSPEIISLALRYAVQQDISSAVVGMKSLSEVDFNIQEGITTKPLSETEEKQLFDSANSLSKTFCRQCEYCLPCDQGLDIPTIFIYYKHYTRFGAHEVSRQRYASLKVKVNACIECGKCEERCPYELPIRELLKTAESILA